jgi:hypothetical protein
MAAYDEALEFFGGPKAAKPKPKPPTPGVPTYAEKVATGNQQAQERAKQEASDKEGYLTSVQGQADVAARAPAELAADREKAVAALRYNMAQSASQGRGLMGGGAGLAASRQLSRERGVGQSEIQNRYTQALQEAAARAAGAQSEVYAERQRVRQAEEVKAAGLVDLSSAVREIKNSAESWQTKKARLRAMRDAELDPVRRDYLTKEINMNFE